MDISLQNSEQSLNSFISYKIHKKRCTEKMPAKYSSKVEKSVIEVPFVIKKEKDFYVVECIDLNIVTQGKTLKAARKNMVEALNLHFKSAFELGMLDNELEKLGVVKKKSKLEVPPRDLESAPIEIPC